MSVTAIVGLSGVGKTTILGRLAEQFEFLDISASEVMKSRFQKLRGQSVSSEDLRTGQVSRNQQYFIAGVMEAMNGHQGPIILDCHVIIDNDKEIIELPSDVFSALGVSTVIVLTKDPTGIYRHRIEDKERRRPFRSTKELAAQQELCVSVAKRISMDIQAKFFVAPAHELGELFRTLSIAPKERVIA